MEYVQFDIQNFKGIEHLCLDLRKVTGSRVSVLIGLNESGKTTVLEAINFFNQEKKRSAGPFSESLSGVSPNDLVPISKKANFNGTISVRATLSLSMDDLDDIEAIATRNGIRLEREALSSELSITRKLNFGNSEYQQSENVWNIALIGRKKGAKKAADIHARHREEWIKIVNEIAELLPPILFFPTFLFDFPEKIYIEPSDQRPASNDHYKQLLQDVLDSLDEDLDLRNHIVERLKPNADESFVGRVLDRYLGDKNRTLQAVLSGG